eukprot:gene4225-3012_t
MSVDNPDPDVSAEIPDPSGPTKLEVEDVDDNCFICGESGENSLFQQSPLTGLHAVGGLGKPMPRALSSLLGSTSPDLQSSTGVMRNDIEWGLCCKFCVFAQSLNGESHVLDAQLNSLGMLGHSSTVPHHNRREGQQRNIVALGKRVPSSFRQRWQLARLLERTWVKMTNTRLALPFLRPLLPISLPHSGRLSTAAEDQQIETDGLVTLLEEIHALRFDSTDVFVHAIERLRQCVANRLSQTPGSPKQRDLVQMAFDTIAVAGSGFLHRREARLWSERALLKTREDEALTASSSTETSSGTASSAVLAARKRRSGVPSSSNVADASKSVDLLASSLAGQETASALHPSRQALLQRSIVEAPLEDDSELMLRRMQETTQHLLALQARFQLMHDVQRQQRLVGTTSHDVVSLGEVGVVQELKLANDNLRWKIQQRDALLVNAYQQIAALQQRLAEQET